MIFKLVILFPAKDDIRIAALWYEEKQKGLESVLLPM
jgi:hypothetical protein